MLKQVESYSHSESKRKNIPTEQLQNFVSDETQQAVTVEYQRRNPDFDPQLIWKGKYDGGDVLSIGARPLYIQEKIHPKAIIENLRKASMEVTSAPSLFEETFGMPPEVDRMDFYKHDQNWTNRMILGDSLQVMASLANREGLRGKVQTIYIDPPYGIKFNSNFQWSTTTTQVKDGNPDSMTREPEMVKAFRDTWRYGIHSYLNYLYDRILIAKDLLSETGSIFIQIGDENVHRVRILLDEIFGEKNYVTSIYFRKTGSQSDDNLGSAFDTILWYAKDKSVYKFNKLSITGVNPEVDEKYYTNILLPNGKRRKMTAEERSHQISIPAGSQIFRYGPITSQGASKNDQVLEMFGKKFPPKENRHWATTTQGMYRVYKSGRMLTIGNNLAFDLRWDEVPKNIGNVWQDTQSGGFNAEKMYVVETTTTVIQRCILMTSDPGDLVLDPTCGSGTTAFVAEQWGRRWITIDTSRVALALARTRLMAAKFPFYIIKDSREGRLIESTISNNKVSLSGTSNSLKLGFIYHRMPHVTVKDIANNSEIDIIYDKYKHQIDEILFEINSCGCGRFNEWDVLEKVKFNDKFNALVDKLSLVQSERRKEMEQSIVKNCSYENLYDKPYINKDIVRVTGPFTVESLSPHRILNVDADGRTIDPMSSEQCGEAKDFATMIIGNLRTNGIQQSDKSGKLDFICIEEFPGDYLCAEGRYMEGDQERRAGILIGPEFGTLTKADIMAAAREAVDCGFSLLVACAFHFDAQSSDVTKLGRLPIMKVMMNTDLMMGDALKGKGNLFVAFGEPDIVLETAEDDQLRVRVCGVDIFFPNTGEVRSDNEDGIACWFVDTDYDQESFFVRQAYFLGAKNPYESLKKTLKTDIDENTWETLHSNVSRTFPKPKSGYVAVKVINHLGDEAMKVLRV